MSLFHATAATNKQRASPVREARHAIMYHWSASAQVRQDFLSQITLGLKAHNPLHRLAVLE